MDFKGQRIDAHNRWPLSTVFRAEIEFQDRLSAQNGQIPFKPIPLVVNKNSEFQRCVGHLIDGLDGLPYRPDLAFDHFFKLLDLCKKQLAPNNGVRGVMEALPNELIQLDDKCWEQIANEFGKSIPSVTVDFLAKRLIESYLGQGKYAKELKERAESCMGKEFYVAFGKKFTTDEKGQPLADFKCNLPKAGSLLRLYLSGKKGTRKEKATVSALDIRKNPVSAVTRMRVLLSLLLFTVRNERAHGAVISPFRTSKAALVRYQSYYFLMLAAYVFAIGTLSLRFPGQSVAAEDILAGCKTNLDEQEFFFK